MARDNHASPGRSPAGTALAVTVLILLAKTVGLLRDILLADAYGTGADSVAFETAAKLPTLLFDLLVAGFVTLAMVPVFNRLLVREGRASALRFASAYVNLTFLATASLAALAVLLAPRLVSLLAPELPADVAAEAVRLTRLMMPQLPLAGLAFCFVGILQSLDSCRLPASISIFSGLLVIGYLLTLDSSWGVTGLAIASLAGWLLQALVQVPMLHRLGYRHVFTLKINRQAAGETVRAALPMLAAAWSASLASLMTTRYASGVADGRAITAFSYAGKIYLIGAGIFSLVATNLLYPRFSREAAAGVSGSESHLRPAIKTLLYLTAPVSAAVWALASPAVRILFQHGAFSAEDTAMTASALSVLAVGIALNAVCELLSKVLYAHGINRAPLLASLAQLAVTTLAARLLVGGYGITGVAAAVLLGTAASAVIHICYSCRTGILCLAKDDVFGVCITSVASAIAGLAAHHLLAGISGLLPEWLTLLISGVAGLLIYGLLVYPLRRKDIRALLALAGIGGRP